MLDRFGVERRRPRHDLIDGRARVRLHRLAVAAVAVVARVVAEVQPGVVRDVERHVQAPQHVHLARPAPSVSADDWRAQHRRDHACRRPTSSPSSAPERDACGPSTAPGCSSAATCSGTCSLSNAPPCSVVTQNRRGGRVNTGSARVRRRDSSDGSTGSASVAPPSPTQHLPSRDVDDLSLPFHRSPHWNAASLELRPSAPRPRRGRRCVPPFASALRASSSAQPSAAGSSQRRVGEAEEVARQARLDLAAGQHQRHQLGRAVETASSIAVRRPAAPSSCRPASCPISLPLASNRRCAVRKRPSASKPSVAKPSGLIDRARGSRRRPCPASR